MHEQVSLWRFQNQIRILKKAQNICKNNNISTKVIPPKLLSPFLEKSSLEDDEFLQEKWTNLFVNMIDSKQNIQNHVFPYILSQLSKDEYSYLESKILDKKQKNIELKKELLDLEKNKEPKEKELKTKLAKLKLKIEKSNNDFHSKEARELRRKKYRIESEIRNLDLSSFCIKRRIKASAIIKETELEDFEIANIIRLGLAKIDYETSAASHTIDIPASSEDEDVSVDLDIEIETDITITITELGTLFIEACCDKYTSNI